MKKKIFLHEKKSDVLVFNYELVFWNHSLEAHIKSFNTMC